MLIASSSEEPSGLPVPDSSKSFWHSEPNEYLLGHRTTSDLPSEADIVIVGSGITGTSIARFLSQDSRANGKKVVMLEAREACWGATGRNGGHCQPLLFFRGPDVGAFELKNVAAVKSYIEEHSIPCEWRTIHGCATFWSEDAWLAAESAVSALKKAAPEIGKFVQVVTDKEELKSHRVSPDCHGATLTQGAGQLWPYKYVTFILEKLIKSSFLNLQTTTPVLKLSSISGATDGYHNTLETPRGSIRVKTVLLATNGYTSHLLNEFSDLIVPVRGEMSALFPPKGSTRLPNSYGFTGFEGQNPSHDDYLIHRPYEGVPNPAGHLMFGGGRSFAKLPSMHMFDDSVVDKGSAAYLRRTLLKVLQLGGETEGLDELKASHEWTGIMGYSRDDHPWVGAVPGRPGVYLSGGYTGHGMPNGTLCGKAVALMALAEEEGSDVRALQEKMVKDGDLPAGYLITLQRIKEARKMLSVEEMDIAGGMKYKSLELSE